MSGKEDVGFHFEHSFFLLNIYSIESFTLEIISRQFICLPGSPHNVLQGKLKAINFTINVLMDSCHVRRAFKVRRMVPYTLIYKRCHLVYNTTTEKAGKGGERKMIFYSKWYIFVACEKK